MKKHHFNFRSGFTLIEMLIVVGVLGVLIGLLAPAILKNVKVAQEKGRANERVVLEAAIFEFWHDQNKWPIKRGDKPKKNKKGKVVYTLTYSDNNYEVFNQLIDADFGGSKKIKTYIDTGRHITTAEKESTYPSFAAAPLRDVLEGRNNFSRRSDPVLVYWGEFIECPECKGSGADSYSNITATECSNNNCPYYIQKGKRYRFEPSDRKNSIRGLRPYKVTIDLLNNSVRVTE